MSSTLIVTTAADVVDATDGVLSLREAVTAVNANVDQTTITFASGTGDVFETPQTINLTGGELVLSSDVIIDGNGSSGEIGRLTIDAGDASRIFSVTEDSAKLEGLTLTGGDGDKGGAVYAFQNVELEVSESAIVSNTARSGGAIYASFSGTLSIIDSIFDANTAFDGAGGAIYSGSSTETIIAGSLFTDNSATRTGGALRANNGEITVVNTTVSGNSAGLRGGGFQLNTGTLSLYSSTLTGNTAQLGGGLDLTAADGTINNSIILGNESTYSPAADDNVRVSSGSLTQQNSILSGDPLTVFDAIDAMTGGGLLADNGGILQTVALKSGGAAVDGGSVALLPTETVLGVDLNNNGTLETTPIGTDGRGSGFDRSVGAETDIGAFEIQSPFDGVEVVATAGDDFLEGTADADLLDGAGGNDFIFGFNGDDVLLGRSGNDIISAGGGNDQAEGGTGRDFITLGQGDDVANGQGGDDFIVGAAGDDSLQGGSGNDLLMGGVGEDNLNGGGNNDTLFGEGGNDFIRGAAGEDTLSGGVGNDTLLGDSGADVLIGEAGNDTMTGGAQRDTFIFSRNSGSDQILDFEDGLDILSLSSEITGGTLDAQTVLNTYATQSGADVVFDFGGGNNLTIVGIAVNALADDMNIF